MATASRSVSEASTAVDEATRMVCARHLHQVFWIPENASHGRLRITFATTSNWADGNLPVVLLCPPMFGGRDMILYFNHFATSHGIRIVCFDRPAMGGSTPVPLQDRMKVWLETVPALLKHLDVDHVGLLCHSAGTIYCLNTLYYLRDILDLKHPYVAMIAPWVHNEHSNAMLMNIASKIPVGIMNSWHNVMKFVATTIQPSVAWSGGISSAMTGIFQTKTDSSVPESAALAAKLGTSEEVAKEVRKLTTKYFFAEDTSGGTEEAKLCLKKGGTNLWLICEDYKEYLQSLVTQEKERSIANHAHEKVKIRVFYAESDIMIGEGGKAYFDECWKQPDVLNTFDFESQTMPGTDHESVIVDWEKGALQKVFADIKATPPVSGFT